MRRLIDVPAADCMVALQVEDARVNHGYGVVSIEADTLEESRRVLARSIALDIEHIPRGCYRGEDKSLPMDKASTYARLLVEEFQGGIAVEDLAKALVSALLERDEDEAMPFASWLRVESGRALCSSSAGPI